MTSGRTFGTVTRLEQQMPPDLSPSGLSLGYNGHSPLALQVSSSIVYVGTNRGVTWIPW